MVFLAAESWELPTKDLLSWIFDEPSYDLDRPVKLPIFQCAGRYEADAVS